MTLFGLLNLNKPAGITSRDAVNLVQRLVPPDVKLGHAGTLDPLATGVLVVTVGPATRLTSRIQQWPKTYRAKYLLGRASDTEDIAGTVAVDPQARPIPIDRLLAALPGLTGTISQRPPAYSAVKVRGQRAYRLARRGQAVELAPRPVTIHRLHITGYAYPELELEVVCGSGTYVRSLGRDLAEAVGTRAVMSELTRTAVGDLTIDTAVDPYQLNTSNIESSLLPASAAAAGLAAVVLNAAQLQRIAHGMSIECPDQPDSELAALMPDGQLAAILSRTDEGDYHPGCNFVPSQTRVGIDSAD
jgi:tRNA pseudouridine55 synthase